MQNTRDNLVRTNTVVRTSAIQAILPARLQFWYLQQQQIAILRRSVSYKATLTLNAMAKEELPRWIKNLELSNGRAIIHPPSQMLMQTDASKKGCGAVCQGIRIGGLWLKKGQEYHINLLEFLAIKFALLTFSKMMNFKYVRWEGQRVRNLSEFRRRFGIIFSSIRSWLLRSTSQVTWIIWQTGSREIKRIPQNESYVHKYSRKFVRRWINQW